MLIIEFFYHTIVRIKNLLCIARECPFIDKLNLFYCIPDYRQADGGVTPTHNIQEVFKTDTA